MFKRRKLTEKADSPAAAEDYATYLLSLRGRTEAELSKKLTEKGFLPRIAASAVGAMRERKYLDDETLGASLVDSYARYKKYGYRYLQQLLLKRGLKSSAVTRILDEHFTETIELGVARRLVDKLGPLPKEKLASRLVSRGFRMSVLSKLVSNGNDLAFVDDDPLP